MKLYSFKDDYSEGCHSSILAMLQKTNLEQQIGYGDDEYSIKAKEFIQQKIGDTDIDIYFTSGGTQANLIVISSILRPHESVISAATGHINVHEAGAIEATGHKVSTIVSSDGKIKVKDIDYIDIDPFGSPNPFLDSAIANKKYVYLAITSTDTSGLAGSYKNACLRKYWALPLHTPKTRVCVGSKRHFP